MRLNVAAGARPLEGYINSDVTPQSADIDEVDVLKLVDAYGKNTADEIRADWLVCHLTVPEFKVFLAQAYTVLKPGGLLRFIDAHMVMWVKWCIRTGDMNAMHDILYSRQRHEHDYHKQGIYPTKCQLMLKKAGYVEVEVKAHTNYDKAMVDLLVTARKVSDAS